MIYGYARVSTKGQERSGNSLPEQEKALLDAGCEVIYKDSCTGTKMERPEFSKLMAELKAGDRFVVTKLDRFARNTAGGIATIKELFDRGIGVHVLNIGLIDNTPTGNLMVTMLLAFAEFERNMIVERTMSGKAVARANNPDWREGRKEKELDEAVVVEFRKKVDNGEMSVSQCCRELGISRSLWYGRLKEAV